MLKHKEFSSIRLEDEIKCQLGDDFYKVARRKTTGA
jgi:hypothetical protein